MAGAPVGNNNPGKAKPWAAAIARALEARSIVQQKPALDELANALIEKGVAGDLSAIQEIANRLDGKAAQSLTIGGDAANPIETQRRVIFVRNTVP